MSATIYRTHKHHIIPKHMGGGNKPNNLTPPISVPLHAALHQDLYKHFGKQEDYIAWKMLSGQPIKIDKQYEKTKRKISLSMMKNTNGFKSGKQNINYKKPRSKDIKKKISIKMKGNIPWNKGVTGYHHSS